MVNAPSKKRGEMSRELPILYSTPMVQTILAGRKDMTRRVINTEIACNYDGGPVFEDGNGDLHPIESYARYQPGDLLWVKEGIARVPRMFDTASGYHTEAVYAADNTPVVGVNWVWKHDSLPGMFMPKSCARLWLSVESVRAERLQDITGEDAVREGCPGEYRYNHPVETSCKQFQILWDSINGKAHPWDSNPWVWVYGFRRIEHA